MTTETATEATFGITDLGQAAFLLARGHPLVGMTGLPGGRRGILFPAGGQVERRGLLRGRARGARAMATALRDLKALLATA